MKTITAIFMYFFVVSAGAAGFCERPKTIDPESPAGLTGRYEMIGRLPGANSGYTGVVEIKEGKTAYALTRTVAGRSETGEGWIELCSPDKFMQFKFQYKNAKQPLFGFCYFRTNADNYFLMSCYTQFAATDFEHHGLESLFQIQEP